MKNKDYQALTAIEDALKIVRKCFVEEKKGNKEARNNTKDLLKEHFVKTADGSYTLKSNDLDGKSETMHTYHGAITESMEKFVKPSDLKGKNEIRILDICSGLGYNAASCIEFLKDDDDVNIEIDMIEISKETLAASLLTPNPIKSCEIVKKAIEGKLYEIGFAGFKFYEEDSINNLNINTGKKNDIKINIFCADARDMVKEIKNSHYDAVFLDPFSPTKSPELYTVEFFLILKKMLKKEGILSTYTSAAPVRSALIYAGFHVGEGPSFGRKGGTIASLSLEKIKKPLSMEDERMIALSDAGIPFKDPQLNDLGNTITKRRNDERKELRGSSKFASTVKTPIYIFKDIDDDRLKRRVLKNLKELGIDDLNSKNARFIVCPQFKECICNCGFRKFKGSSMRINEMERRLSIITK